MFVVKLKGADAGEQTTQVRVELARVRRLAKDCQQSAV